MHVKSQKEFFSGLLFIAVGVAFAVGASFYPMGTSLEPGAGFLPLILAVLLVLLGIVVLFKSLAIETEGGDPIGAIAWRPLCVVVGSIVVFGLSIERLGLLVAVPLVVVMTSFSAAPVRWRGVLVHAVLLTAFCWLVFVVGLKLHMPLLPAVGG